MKIMHTISKSIFDKKVKNTLISRIYQLHQASAPTRYAKTSGMQTTKEKNKREKKTKNRHGVETLATAAF
jgi:hypothetical protein